MASTDIAALLEHGTAGYGAAPYSVIIPNNTTGVVVKANPGLLFDIAAFNNTATIAYLKIYDKATAPTTTDTPVLRYMIPASSGFVFNSRCGEFFASGISYRVTTGIADNDTGAPGATTYLLDLGWK